MSQGDDGRLSIDNSRPAPPAEDQLRFSRRAHVTDPDAAFAELQGENDSLVAQIASLEARIPSKEELAYLRNRKEADERAAWAWQMVRKYAPWVTTVTGVLGSGAYWLVNTFQFRSHP